MKIGWESHNGQILCDECCEGGEEWLPMEAKICEEDDEVAVIICDKSKKRIL